MSNEITTYEDLEKIHNEALSIREEVKAESVLGATMACRAADEYLTADILSWYTDEVGFDEWLDMLGDLNDKQLASVVEFASNMGDIYDGS